MKNPFSVLLMKPWGSSSIYGSRCSYMLNQVSVASSHSVVHVWWFFCSRCQNTDWNKHDDRLMKAVERGEADKVAAVLNKKGIIPTKLDVEGRSAWVNKNTETADTEGKKGVICFTLVSWTFEKEMVQHCFLVELFKSFKTHQDIAVLSAPHDIPHCVPQIRHLVWKFLTDYLTILSLTQFFYGTFE